MNSRILIAGLVGGIAMYVWASVAHLSPLGMTGFRQMSNEGPAVAGMQAATGDKAGLYMFPAVDKSAKDAMTVYEAKLKTSPSGLLLYHPAGARGMEPRQLVGEFVLELIEATLAVWLMSLTRLTGFAGRVGFMCGIGAIAAISTNASYWLWYGFPGAFSIAAMVMEFGKYVFAGLAAAAVLGRRRGAVPA
jgi:hypothetical protein